MADDHSENEATTEPTMIERWLADQQAWQKTALAYLDSMVHNDEFLVHLGNAMRGSLLAGKAYPAQPPPGAAEPLSETDECIDQILHALHLIQGELRDLRAAVDKLSPAETTRAPARPKAAHARPKKAKKAKARPREAESAEGGESG